MGRSWILYILDSIVMELIWQCNGVQHMFDTPKLTLSLCSDSTVDDIQEPRISFINYVQMNTRIIDCHKN